jgi:hypothetical protein
VLRENRHSRLDGRMIELWCVDELTCCCVGIVVREGEEAVDVLLC